MTDMTTLVTRLKALAAKKDLAIGEAWNALDDAADAIDGIEHWLVPIVERMRLVADVQEKARPEWAHTLRAFAKDVEAAYRLGENK
jgi:ABC-type transporter Mla subunit MlaD